MHFLLKTSQNARFWVHFPQKTWQFRPIGTPARHLPPFTRIPADTPTNHTNQPPRPGGTLRAANHHQISGVEFWSISLHG
jgi:hypothetical protein